MLLLAGLAAACTGANPAFMIPSQLDAPPSFDAPAGEAGTDAAGSDAAGSDAAGSDAAGSDAAGSDAAGSDAAGPDAPPDAFVPPAGCGTGTADVTGIDNADGVQVDTDGTVYFLSDDAVHSYVGRIRPGQAPEPRWVRVDNSPTTWGLALDSARKRLYVLVVDGQGALVAFDNITGAPVGSQFVTGINNGNDVVVAPDGAVYYSQQGNRHVYRVPPEGGAPALVTMTPVGSNVLNQAPAALAIAPDGSLLVGLERGGPIYKLTLAAGREVGRAPLGSWMGWANGLAHDRRQRLYVAMYDDTAPRAVVRLEADGSAIPITTGSRFSSIAFGRGALDCRDLYVADPNGPMRRVRVGDSL
jgi:hypothetical protein